MQVCTSLQTDNHASTPPLSCLQAGCPSCRPTNIVKALKGQYLLTYGHWKWQTTGRAWTHRGIFAAVTANSSVGSVHCRHLDVVLTSSVTHRRRVGVERIWLWHSTFQPGQRNHRHLTIPAWNWETMFENMHFYVFFWFQKHVTFYVFSWNDVTKSLVLNPSNEFT